MGSLVSAEYDTQLGYHWVESNVTGATPHRSAPCEGTTGVALQCYTVDTLVESPHILTVSKRERPNHCFAGLLRVGSYVPTLS
jgi:hypothetical protein